MKEMLREYVDSRGVKMRVDRRAGIIRGVKILGLESRNGRHYPAETLLRAVELYDGAKVNVNHANGSPAGPRDYRDRIGAIRNVRLRPEDGLFADFHFNPKHALAEQLIWDAENAAENVGFSHNVRAKTARRDDHVEVEEITKVESVDLVADPATTRGLFESAAEAAEENPAAAGGSAVDIFNADMVSNAENCRQDDPAREAFLTGLSVESLRRDRPELVQELLEESRDELQSLRRELVRLRESASRERRERLIGELLSEFNLPLAEVGGGACEAVIDRRFMQSLREATDEKTVRGLIQERAELVRAVERGIGATGGSAGAAAGKPLCRGQVRLAEPADDTNSFVKSIT